MPLAGQMIQVGLPTGQFAAMPSSRRVRLRGADRQLAGPARADRRRRRDHPVELPAAPGRLQGRPRARRRLHRRAQAERGRAAHRLHAGRGDRGGRAAAGVFNLVTGTGPVVGEAIAAHPGVDMVSFTGSTRAGRRVSELAAATVKRVALELGGKSPTSSSTTPTSPGRSPTASPSASSTPARPAAP